LAVSNAVVGLFLAVGLVIDIVAAYCLAVNPAGSWQVFGLNMLT